MNKFSVVYLYNEVLNNGENEWNAATSIIVYESLKTNSRWKKQVTKAYIQYDSICMNFKNKQNII